MAAIFALSLVPAGAWADTKGVMGTTTDGKGTITVKNTKASETYNLYRLFELASFSDDVTTPGIHTGDKYSYVIRDTDGASTTKSFYDWLIAQGYAVLRTADNTPASPSTGQLFWIEKDPVSLADPTGTVQNDYRVITATTNFPNSLDVATTDGTGTFNYSTADYATPGTGKESIKTVQDFAQAALAWAEANATPVNPSSNTVATDGEDLAISDLPLGYYLLSTTSGSLASLDTNNKDVNVYDKNDEPTIEKKVYDAADGTWVENVSANIGDTMTFRTQIVAKQGAENYELHDVMEKGLTYTGAGDIEITLTRADGTTVYKVPATVASGIRPNEDANALTSNWTNWTESHAATAGGYMADGCDFEILFSDSLIGLGPGESVVYHRVDIKDDDVITVTYKATVNSNAVIYGSETPEANGGDQTTVRTTDKAQSAETSKEQIAPKVYRDSNTDDRNTNSTVLTYANKSYTSWDDATVTTYQFDVVKTKDGTAAFELLEGAEFELYEAADPTDANSPEYTLGASVYDKGSIIKFAAADSNNNYACAGTGTAESGQTNTLASTAAKEIHVTGLKAGTYLLVEKTAPNGYNKLAHPIAVTIIDNTAHDKATPNTNNDEGKITTVTVSNDGTAGGITAAAAWNASAITVSGSSATQALSDGGIRVVNKTGQELPSTGGIGTTIFYVAGTVLVVGAAVMLVAKRRMGSES